MIGIAICTYNRSEHLRRLISEILEKTSADYTLVVCDDGSTDATQQVCEAAHVARIGEKNRGIAWNKNRGLYYLHEKMNCDWVVIIEDDMSITAPGWENSWEAVVLQYGHVNWTPRRTGSFWPSGGANSLITAIGA